MFHQVDNLICIEKFSDFAQLGRFTLRTEGEGSMFIDIFSGFPEAVMTH